MTEKWPLTCGNTEYDDAKRRVEKALTMLQEGSLKN